MNTRTYATEYRMAHWGGIMRERKESGLSVRAFCEGAGIHENRYYYWQKRLREAACEELARIDDSTTSIARPVFAKVNLSERSGLQPASVALQGHICIEAPGVRITAGSEYPVGKLSDLLRTVMQPCC